MDTTLPRFALLSAALWLAAAGAAGAASPRRLAMDGRVAGEITGADPMNLNDGSRSVAFEVDLREGQAVSIEAAAVFCGRLALFASEQGGRQRPVRVFEPGACREQDGRQVLTQSLVVPEGGRYTLAFSGRSGSDYGPFTLALEEIRVEADRTLVPGDDVRGLLAGESRQVPLRITEAGRYVIELLSSEFDPLLRLEGEGVSRENDDAGGDLNSRLVAYLQPGDYRLGVARAGGEGGLYQLRVAASGFALPPGTRLQNDGELAAGRITGMLEGEGNRYRLRLGARSRVEFAVESSEIDPRILVTGPGAPVTDDDSGGGTDARLVVALEPGDYAVVVDDVSGADAGLYTLRTAVAPTGDAMPGVRPGTPAEGRLGAGEQHLYRFDVDVAGRYVIDLASPEFDAIVHLARGGEVVGSDDDGAGEGTDSRLAMELAPGRYEIVVMALGGDGGRYRLDVARR